MKDSLENREHTVFGGHEEMGGQARIRLMGKPDQCGSLLKDFLQDRIWFLHKEYSGCSVGMN